MNDPAISQSTPAPDQSKEPSDITPTDSSVDQKPTEAPLVDPLVSSPVDAAVVTRTPEVETPSDGAAQGSVTPIDAPAANPLPEIPVVDNTVITPEPVASEPSVNENPTSQLDTTPTQTLETPTTDAAPTTFGSQAPGQPQHEGFMAKILGIFKK